MASREVLNLPSNAQPGGPAVDSARARQVAEIESLSEDEAEALLLKELSSGNDRALKV